MFFAVAPIPGSTAGTTDCLRLRPVRTMPARKPLNKFLFVALFVSGEVDRLSIGEKWLFSRRFFWTATAPFVSFRKFSANCCASHAETRFESSMVHHTRTFVTIFPGVRPLSPRTRRSFTASKVSAEPYFIEAPAILRFVSGPQKYFSKLFRIFGAETGSNLALTMQVRALLASETGLYQGRFAILNSRWGFRRC